MKRLVILDPSRCTGCRICEVTCALAKEGQFNPRLARIRVLKDDHRGEDKLNICWHCEKAPCINGCPDHAIVRDPHSDAVIVDEERCSGCRKCIQTCPLGVLFMNPRKNKVFKCDLYSGEPECVKSCTTKVLGFVTLP